MGFAFFAEDQSTTRRTFTVKNPETGEPEEHFLDLRTDLSAAEWADLDSGFVRKVGADRTIDVDMARMGAQRRALWISSWSLTTNRGAAIKPTVDMCAKLTGKAADIIDEIVVDHEERMRAERQAAEDPTPRAESSTVEASSASPATPSSGTNSLEPVASASSASTSGGAGSPS